MESFFTYFLAIHKRNRLFSHCLFWGIVYGFGWLEMHFNSGLSPTQSAVQILWLMLNRIPVAYLMMYVLVPLFFQKRRFWWAIPLFLIGCYGLFLFTSAIKPLLLGATEKIGFSTLTDARFFIQNYLLQHIEAGFFLLIIKMLLTQVETQRKALNLEKQKAELELKLLKTQLNPHFLFNTLNNIYALAVLQSPQTPEAVGRLSNILDYILYRCNAQEVPLSNELTLLDNYIALEKIRYDDRLQVNFQQKVERNIAIVPLILLTIVENAFKHGASEGTGMAFIDIDLTANTDTFSFRVRNNYLEKEGNQQPLKIGLANVRQQLELIYTNRYILNMDGNAPIFTVELNIFQPNLCA